MTVSTSVAECFQQQETFFFEVVSAVPDGDRRESARKLTERLRGLGEDDDRHELGLTPAMTYVSPPILQDDRFVCMVDATGLSPGAVAHVLDLFDQELGSSTTGITVDIYRGATAEYERRFEVRHSKVLSLDERRRAFLAGGLHALNVEVVRARLLPLEMPVGAEASPLALMHWLRDPVVLAATHERINQDGFLPVEAPDWDPKQPASWIAAENQFHWIAQLAQDTSSPDPDVELREPDGSGHESVLLGRVPLSELTARVFQVDHVPISGAIFGSTQATVANLLRLPDAHHVLVARPPEVRGVISWGGMVVGDVWSASYTSKDVWVRTAAEHEAAVRAQLEHIADDWAARAVEAPPPAFMCFDETTRSPWEFF